ncbi:MULTISPECIES: tetraacyldisaccharide 4'-kinase [Halanaerobium]|jgi:tetraacyldisaccharide 4'-kinase|uniref:Tetraacyldisaccharide 4'-kinase n=2 Tax=Halanaerobium TaxID=2330 RepID=A0A4R6SIZ4_9FIRM|nr:MULTISPECIES: tetraacyldisaccharide 4'-kinase [Halanaerobium]PUU94230.1 MAG: tetraacyldisaccharide 4'-kinase [Halanaerobium sp.]RCW62253.1 lipid-A-disaccharide kinase [Halanaerobium sp. ST460_2HS_T2]TDQ01617.1 lipid-A-disaccharide kinase [Halanaerobium saccharolyticum]SIR51709.1 lipid-A-disaccharide kinase [Halanaerobium kushneri]
MNSLRRYLEKIIDGSQTGIVAAIIRCILFLLSLFYSQLAKIRSILYQNNILKKKTADVPVISVGNITTGGTGKTPFTAFLAEQLKADYRIAIISRGYGASKDVEEPFLIKDRDQLYADAARAGDELFMLARRNDDLIFIRSASRYQGTKLAQEKGADLILLDDGFQHYQLKRQADIVLIDAEKPFSNNRVLPAGLLREPFAALKRADLFLINRSENVDFNRIKELKNSLNTLSPLNKGVFRAETRLESCVSVASQVQENLDFLKEKKVFAFSGIGSPEAFKKSIESAGARVVSYRIFKDHYNYQKEDLLTLLDQYSASQADLILTTEKDAVKLFDFADMIGELPFYFLKISLAIENREELLEIIRAQIKNGRAK